jgi:hypothetical protein
LLLQACGQDYKSTNALCEAVIRTAIGVSSAQK